MHKSVIHLIMAGVVASVGIAAALLTVFHREPSPEEILASYGEQTECSGLTIDYPLNETIFPPDIASPTFHWTDSNGKSDQWLVTIDFQDHRKPLSFLTQEARWRPARKDWETIKKRSLEREARVTIFGLQRSEQRKILSRGEAVISASRDEVGAPIFYREVILPFIDAVKDPSRLRWRFGSISSTQQPPIVLEKLPVCGNCHSFSADGKVLGMDVDYANDKGSYAITHVSEQIVLDRDHIITWSDYKRSDKVLTFGLLPQISPDGKVAISTVKDRSVFVPKPDLAFSQLFFPLKGILVVYSRETKTFTALPGADDPQYVQSNPTWSPDGEYIVFARSNAYHLKSIGDRGQLLLTPEECREFLVEGKPFKYDLYRVPYNDGKGGRPAPLEGASSNGMSNYFAKYSPDGKWIVFCMAKNYMLLQPDSELYIIPAEGGAPRRLRCNTSRMNSWHSWSPNSKWLVFSSKVNGPYTQLFLTHIDERGYSSPPVVLEHFTAPDRAANIPEFVNANPRAIRRIKEQFVDEYSYLRAGEKYFKYLETDKDVEQAVRTYQKALDLNPKSVEAYCSLGWAMTHQKKYNKAVRYYRQALEIDPNCVPAHGSLGTLLSAMGMIKEGAKHLSEAVRLSPKDSYLRHNFGMTLFRQGKYEEAISQYRKALDIKPDRTATLVNLGQALRQVGNYDEAMKCYSQALEIEPDHVEAHSRLGCLLLDRDMLEEAAEHFSKAAELDPQNASLHHNLGVTLFRQGKYAEAISHYRKALDIKPDLTASLVSLAQALRQVGKYDEAIGCYYRALEIEPDHARTHANLGLLLLAKGMREKAAEHLLKAARLDPRASDPVVDALKENDKKVRVWAAAALHLLDYKKEKQMERLIAAAKDKDRHIREVAMKALAATGDPRAVVPLIAALKDKDSVVRDGAAYALGMMGHPRAVGPLVAALKDKDWHVRCSAAQALGLIKGSRAVKPLIAALKDEHPDVQVAAAGALLRLNYQRDKQMERLISALKNKPWSSQATRVLREVTGEDFGTDASKWRAWWDQNKGHFEPKKLL